MSVFNEIQEALSDLSNKEKAVFHQRFFKTGKGGYGEGDTFIGVVVPDLRKIAKASYKNISPADTQKLLQSAIHEYRLLAVIILTLQYQAAKTQADRKRLFDFYLANRQYVNNWDIVDSSTHKIVGPHVHETQAYDVLNKLAEEDNMWSKRIAVVALFYLWKQGYARQGLKLISKNLEHPHDLMHKANGWMLRELAKQGQDEEAMMLEYLEQHYDKIPRTTLRYAIEKIDEPKRKAILRGEF